MELVVERGKKVCTADVGVEQNERKDSPFPVPFPVRIENSARKSSIEATQEEEE